MEHSDLVFADYLDGYSGEVCPVGGEVWYVDGVVECGVHPLGDDDEEEEEEGPDTGVPYL